MKVISKLLGSIIFSVALGGSAAWAEPTDEETADDGDFDDASIDDTVIVYQDDGTPRVAGSAHIVGEKELERFEYDDIGRILGATPGVYVRGEDGFGLRPNIGLRGTNSDRSSKITLLEDGVPISPAPYAASAAYYFPMSTRLVGVEVFKGPAAIQHGPQTVGGAINMRTRGVPRKADGAVDLGYGMRNAVKLHAWAGTGGPRGGVLAEVAHLQTDGFKNLPSGNKTGFERTDVMFKAKMNTDPALQIRNALELKLGWGQEDSRETYLGLQADDYAADPYRRYGASELGDMRWDRAQAELSWQLDLRNNIRVRTTAYYHWLGRKWFKFNRFRNGPDVHRMLQNPEGGQSAVFLAILRGEEDTTTAGQALMIGSNDRAFKAFGVQSRLRWRAKGEVFDSQLEAGIRLHGDVVDRLHTEGGFQSIGGELKRDSTPLVTTLDSNAKATALALHIQEDLEIADRVHILPGVRSETVYTTYLSSGEASPNVLRTSVLPGFGALVVLARDVSLFTGIYRGFTPVAPGQSADIRPESSWNSEFGLRAGTQGNRVEVVGFVNDYVNITGQCTISGGCAGEQLDTQFNGGKAWVYGAEGIVEHEWLLPKQISVPVSLSYTWTEGFFRTGFVSGFPQYGSVQIGDRLPYMPQHQGGARASIEHPRFGFAVGASARSKMRDVASQGGIDATGIPAQLLIDLALQVRPTDHVELYSTVVNATNTKVMESWRPFGARPTAPFQLMVGVKIRP